MEEMFYLLYKKRNVYVRSSVSQSVALNVLKLKGYFLMLQEDVTGREDRCSDEVNTHSPII